MADTLGERIRQARLRYGMSQAELARRIQISTQGMNLIEAGKTPDPASSRITAIAKVLKVSADYLLGLTNERERLPTASEDTPDKPWSPATAAEDQATTPATATPATPSRKAATPTRATARRRTARPSRKRAAGGRQP